MAGLELNYLRGSTPLNTGLSVPPVQALHDAWDTPAYALGTKFWDGDRCFKYVRAGNTLNSDDLCWMYNYQVLGWKVAPTQTAGLGGKDGKKLLVTIGTSDGVADDGEVIVNQLVGGYITIFKLDAGTSGTDYTFRITGNTGVASNGGTMEVSVANALPHTVTTSAYTEITPNPYQDVRVGSQATVIADTGGRAMLGLPQAFATTTYRYCWIQTWASCFFAPQTTGIPAVGNSNGRQQIVARYDGSCNNHTVYTAGATATGTELANGVHQQHLGFVFTRAQGATSQGTPLMFLQISC